MKILIQFGAGDSAFPAGLHSTTFLSATDAHRLGNFLGAISDGSLNQLSNCSRLACLFMRVSAQVRTDTLARKCDIEREKEKVDLLASITICISGISTRRKL